MNLQPEMHKQLVDIFENWANEKLESFEPIASSGSDRSYFRLKGITKTAIGESNED